MTTQPQPEALRIAQRLYEASTKCDHHYSLDRTAASELERLHAECEALRFTRALAQARYENAVKLLTGIHDLLYPAPVNTPDGRTLVFRPGDQDLHAVLQLLSERIRAIPEELEAAHSSAWWTYRTESQRQRDAARAAKEQSNG